MQQTQQTTQNAQEILAEDSPLMMNLIQSLQEAIRTLRAVRSLTDQLDRHPESLLRGRPSDPSQKGDDEYRVSDGGQP